MSKIAFLFAGQGSQYVGMGKEISQQFEASKEIFKQADEALGFSIMEMCFEGQQEDLNKTENTQPAVLTTSVAILKAVEEKGIKPDVVAGLSLGEYAALVCNGVLAFKTAVQLVKKRGKYMQEAVPQGQGTMAAIIGLDRAVVENICKEASEAGVVEPANYNSSEQIVISGSVAGVELACEKAKAAGAKRALMLAVSGPFHSSMLQPAAEKLGQELSQVEINKIQIPYISNVTGKYVSDDEDIKSLLKRQVMSPVYWEDSIKEMIKDGVDTFVEIGPGKALSGFVKKIDKTKAIYNVEDLKTLEKLVEEVK